ncbi:homogentisate phytyltransferase [Leptolyngbya sp. AN02str]|uniref:homogentisate phytyltransferase n=1 Tax=Leptolyngbya sp. AN02str TaxID=3423363 RepID=UPI003D315686
MSSASSTNPADVPSTSSRFLGRFWKQFPWLYSFWKFSRPHTIIGTSLSVFGLFCVAWAFERGPSLPPLWLTIPALVTCLCGNVYIVGLNQLEDVEIDVINKPHLPIAAGEYTRQQAANIVGIAGLLALVLSLLQGVYLVGTVWLSLFIGTAYSLPPMRLKRFPFYASLCIFGVRGVIVNVGLFLHFRAMLGGDGPIPPEIWVLTLFVLAFTFAIAIFKDIPDVEGDRRYNISTLSIRLGQQTVFNLAVGVLTLCYIGMIAAAFWLAKLNQSVLLLSHTLALVVLYSQSLRINPRHPRSMPRFYQFIWKLFFLEYIIFPLACLWPYM